MADHANGRLDDTLRDHHERIEALEAWKMSAEPVVEVDSEIQQTMLPFLREIVRARQYDEERRRRRSVWIRSWQGVVVGLAAAATFLAFIVAVVASLLAHMR